MPLKSTYTGPPPLPPGWTEHKAPSGHVYYYHAETKKSTYTRPTPPSPASPAPQSLPTFNPESLPPFSSAGYGPTVSGYPSSYTDRNQYGRGRGGHRGSIDFQDRSRRQPEDRPKSKRAIPGCEPWLLVKTKLKRRFVYNPDTNESFWKFPADVLKAVIELDRLEREKKERQERGEEEEENKTDQLESGDKRPLEPATAPTADVGPGDSAVGGDEDSEYEEVEVTDSEGEEEGQHSAKRLRTESEGMEDKPREFNEEDIEYQLAAMGEEYGLDPGEYGEPGDEDWDEGAAGLQLTDEDATALFRDLLDDYHINPYSPWENIIDEGRIIDDNRYTVLPNMKRRREVWSDWSRERIQQLKERKEREEKKDPRIKYFAFLQEYATPKLYWPEFKRKYRKEPEMKHTQMTDRDREKYYREHISRLKLPESTRKSDLSALLKSVGLQHLNRSSTVENLPSVILTDLRYISLAPKIRDDLIQAYISTLPPAPDKTDMSVEEQEESDRKRLERDKRERALAERERRVEEEKRRQRGDLVRGKHMLRQGEAEIEDAMRIGRDGLKGYMEVDDVDEVTKEEQGTS